jgi:two-component system, cell cycle sensor histidine kinase and response regulator CckA
LVDVNRLLAAHPRKGSTELALDLARNAAQREELEEIHRSAERASSLTRDLLAFSRKQILQPRMSSLNEVVVELGRLLLEASTLVGSSST